MDAAAPPAPTADAPMHDRPPSDGSPASPAAAARAAADPVPFTLRTSNDNFEVAGFGQVAGAHHLLATMFTLRAPSAPL